MPDVFARENRNGSPVGSLWITNILVQLFLIVTLYSSSTYQAIFYIASTAILVPYVLSGAYALKRNRSVWAALFARRCLS